MFQEGKSLTGRANLRFVSMYAFRHTSSPVEMIWLKPLNVSSSKNRKGTALAVPSKRNINLGFSP